MSDYCEDYDSSTKRVRFYRERCKKLKPSRKSRKLKKKRSKRKLWRPKSRRRDFQPDDCDVSDECDSVSECVSDSDFDDEDFLEHEFDFEFVVPPEVKTVKPHKDLPYSSIPFNKKLPMIYKGIQFKK